MQPQTVSSMLRVDTEPLCSTGWLASRMRWGPGSLPFWSFLRATWLQCSRTHRPQPCLDTALLIVQVYEEGTHFLIPWFERPVIYDVRTRPNTITSTSGSKDLQMVRAAAMLMT